jgi:hypothetical protein
MKLAEKNLYAAITSTRPVKIFVDKQSAETMKEIGQKKLREANAGSSFPHLCPKVPDAPKEPITSYMGIPVVHCEHGDVIIKEDFSIINSNPYIAIYNNIITSINVKMKERGEDD